MIEQPDEKWTPHVTVIGIGEQGVKVLLKLCEKKREDFNVCVIEIVSDETKTVEMKTRPSLIYVGDIGSMYQESVLHYMIQNSSMFLIVANMEDAFSARVALDIASKEQKYDSNCCCSKWRGTSMVSFAVLITSDGNVGQDDYISQTRAIYMTPEMLRRQCELRAGMFADEIDVLAETAMGISTMPFHNLIGFDVADMQEALSRPGKMTAVFGQGNTAEDAVDNLLLTAEKIGVDLRRCELTVFNMSGTPDRLSLYDVNEAPFLMAKKVGREVDAFCGEPLTLLSAPLDELLGDKLKIFAVFCEGNEKKCHSD